MDEDDPAERKRRRQSWPVKVTRLAASGSENLSATTTAEERLAMMWRLAQDAWALMPGGIPTYTRAETPVRVIRRGKR